MCGRKLRSTMSFLFSEAILKALTSVTLQRPKPKSSPMSAPNPRRGQIWLVDWSPARGSEQMGRRPALIVQTDAANSNPRYPNTIVATVSTSGRNVASHVLLQPSPRNGLSAVSYVKWEQVLTISKDRLQGRLGQNDTHELTK